MGLGTELGIIWNHFRALVPIGTKSQIWGLITSTVLVIWIFSFPRQIFRNRNRDFFPRPNFSETKTFFFRNQIFQNRIKTFFQDQIFPNRNQYFFLRPNFPKPRLFFQRPNFPKPKPSKNWQKFRNREVSKPKCQSLVGGGGQLPFGTFPKIHPIWWRDPSLRQL